MNRRTLHQNILTMTCRRGVRCWCLNPFFIREVVLTHYHFRIGRNVYLPLVVIGPYVLARRDWDLW